MNSLQGIEDAANRRNLRVLVALRGMAFCVQGLLIAWAAYGFGIVLPVPAMLMTAAVLILVNLWAVWRLRQSRPVRDLDLFAGLVFDVAVLAAQFAFSGATSNPLVSFFMLPVILGAVMLSPMRAWLIYGLTLIAYGGLAVIAARQATPMIMDMPSMEMPDMTFGRASPLIDMSDLHMNGMMFGYAVCAGALVWLIARIRGNLNERDRELAELRTRSLEREHILRLGLLTAGAAHELGTPLTTVSVILKDWEDLGPPEASERDSDLRTMRAQVARCKTIISGILAASGQTRGEGTGRAGLAAFVTGMKAGWQALHPAMPLEADIRLPDTVIAADRVLEQALYSLLDNAAEASPAGACLSAYLTAEHLVLRVADDGPGFSPDALAGLGQPYATTKTGDTPRGLGLFLAANTARALGGRLEARNLETGAQVSLILPLEALRADA